MKSKRSVVVVAFFLVAAMGIFLFARPKAEDMKTTVIEEQQPANDFSLQDLNGKTVKLSDFRGKTVVLNFWATWCGPCRKEIPDFIDLQNQYGKDGLQFIGIAIDQEGASVIKPFAENAKMNYPVLVGNDEVFAKFGGSNAIPVTLLIDKKGTIRNTYVGAKPKQAVEDMVLALMREK
ncbi:MAG: TlpA family protein disulfide reductase [Bacteroidetes bacterium]|nr:TlpA family protein disulfide reductase [Bacteroidota bacterium]